MRARFAFVRPGEWLALVVSFLYFFALLAGYFILRPIRDQMGISGGLEKLPLLFTATFVATIVVVPLFGAIAARVPRRRVIPPTYHFFAAHLIVFWALFRSDAFDAPTLARVFFVWVSVYNVFVVSVFWSFMADVWRRDEAKRLFGVISAGGTAGALTGPAVAGFAAPHVGALNLLLVSAALLEVCVVCVVLLRRRAQDRVPDEPIGGGIWAGVTNVLRSRYLSAVAIQTILAATTATFLYFQQAEIVKGAFASRDAQTAYFGRVDLAINLIALGLETFVAGALFARAGLVVGLLITPALALGGFGLVALWPTVTAIAIAQVARRAAQFAFHQPGRQVLFTVVPPEDRYKSKTFIDTVVFRGGDMVSSWASAGLTWFGLAVAGTAIVALPITLAWGAVCAWLGVVEERTAAPR